MLVGILRMSNGRLCFAHSSLSFSVIFAELLNRRSGFRACPCPEQGPRQKLPPGHAKLVQLRADEAVGVRPSVVVTTYGGIVGLVMHR